MWEHAQNLPSRRFTCGYCQNVVASGRGWHDSRWGGQVVASYICPHCEKPTFFWHGERTPGPAFGADVGSLPKDIEILYGEARRSASANAPTAAVLTCRKILMNIAVSRGAAAGGTFLSYVEYLQDKGFVPPGSEGWVDHIRKKGNEANHEIVLMAQDDAHDLITFVEMLLKLIYEFPARVRPTTPGSTP